MPQSPGVKQVTRSRWSCLVCTLDNDPFASKSIFSTFDSNLFIGSCSVCGSERPKTAADVEEEAARKKELNAVKKVVEPEPMDIEPVVEKEVPQVEVSTSNVDILFHQLRSAALRVIS